MHLPVISQKNKGCDQQAKACNTASQNMGCLPNRCSQGRITSNTYSVLQSLQCYHLSQDAALTSTTMNSVKMLQAASRISYVTSEALARRVQIGI